MARALQKMDAQRRYAWCKYYEEINAAHRLTIEQNGRITRIVNGEFPSYVKQGMEIDYIKKELEDITYILSKPYECPICLDFIPKGEMDITNCGHKFCKSCLTTLKQTPEPKCALCRVELWIKKPEAS